MANCLQFRRYRLPLRVPLRTAHEHWTEREGIVVRVQDEAGRCGWGEVAPLPAFGTETVDQAEAALRTLGEDPRPQDFERVPARLGCTRQALATALAELAETGRPRESASPGTLLPGGSARAVAALLPAGRGATARLTDRLEAGFRVFKWKVGVSDPTEEWGVLDELCGVLPAGGKLRLDANGAWDRRTAERWLERAAERPVEFIEQPCFAPRRDGETAWRRAEDLLRGLANDYPTPVALDESLASEDDLDRWLTQGWPGWFVLKPSLMADCPRALARLKHANATVVFSSALETAVGARAALRVAFTWAGEPKALGFGVWPLFTDARFDGPALAPFVRREDVEGMEPEAVWNALS